MERICTILIVTYNQEKYLEKAIESVLSQKTKYAYRVDIFDDASKDKTSEIIKKYEKKYPDRVKAHIAKENMGAQANFWRAVTSVDTKYLMILEGDDYWCDDNKLELQINALEKHPECSFCGHNTYLISLDETSREYEEGSLCCTQAFLKNKKIFTYRDFEDVTNGGYIPYVSARLIRTACLDLDKIKYKETVLFDFTQFYYLLLKGKYFYLDIPMSVYQRTGEGVCSGISPMNFLNTFVSNAIDFNKDTNDIIADKIFSDCMLQMDFRIKLYRNNYLKKSITNLDGTVKKLDDFRDIIRISEINENSLQDDLISGKEVPISKNKTGTGILVLEENFDTSKYYFLLNGGLGFTTILSSLKEKLEEKLGAEIIFLVKEGHSFILEMYGIGSFISVDLNGYNLETLSTQNPNPKKGKIFVAHPFAHEEAVQFYLPVLGMYSTQKYIPWLLEFFELEEDLTIKYPNKLPELEMASQRKMDELGNLSEVVLFLPDGETIHGVAELYWEKMAKKLKKQGYRVYCASLHSRDNVKGCKYIKLNPQEIVYLGMKCHSVYSLRNGFCELLYSKGEKLHVVYPTHAAHFIYSLNKAGKIDTVNEILVLEPQKVHRNIQNKNLMPMLFGIIRVPDKAYMFYHKNRKIFQPARSLIKKVIKWT